MQTFIYRRAGFTLGAQGRFLFPLTVQLAQLSSRRGFTTSTSAFSGKATARIDPYALECVHELLADLRVSHIETDKGALWHALSEHWQEYFPSKSPGGSSATGVPCVLARRTFSNLSNRWTRFQGRQRTLLTKQLPGLPTQSWPAEIAKRWSAIQALHRQKGRGVYNTHHLLEKELLRPLSAPQATGHIHRRVYRPASHPRTSHSATRSSDADQVSETSYREQSPPKPFDTDAFMDWCFTVVQKRCPALMPGEIVEFIHINRDELLDEFEQRILKA